MPSATDPLIINLSTQNDFTEEHKLSNSSGPSARLLRVREPFTACKEDVCKSLNSVCQNESKPDRSRSKSESQLLCDEIVSLTKSRTGKTSPRKSSLASSLIFSVRRRSTSHTAATGKEATTKEHMTDDSKRKDRSKSDPTLPCTRKKSQRKISLMSVFSSQTGRTESASKCENECKTCTTEQFSDKGKQPSRRRKSAPSKPVKENATLDQECSRVRSISETTHRASKDDSFYIELAIISALEELQGEGCMSAPVESIQGMTKEDVANLNSITVKRDKSGRRMAVCETFPEEGLIVKETLYQLQRLRNMLDMVDY